MKLATPRPRHGRAYYNHCPVFRPGDRPGASRTILRNTEIGESVTGHQIVEITGKTLGQISSALKTLLEHGYFRKFGEGREAVYRRIK